MPADLQAAKRAVLELHADLDRALSSPQGAGAIAQVLAGHTIDDWLWRGVHPFDEIVGAAAVADRFWAPLARAMAPLQRRPDVFLAGHNDRGASGSDAGVWVCEMGHLLGLHDRPWLDIPPTGRMCFVRYAEFNRVEPGGRIAESAMFIDIPSVMRQAGHYPFPPATGSLHLYPGPATHDGLLTGEHDAAQGAATMALVNSMIDDLSEANRIANETGVNVVAPEIMARSWAPDMIWSGPDGIGATYTIERYQHQHQYPFRFNLADKVFNGHVARFAEGDYACFFGWANLTNRPTGGFMGLPGSGAADMRVVDVYRRSGDRLAENWVFIDLLHWLSMQGLDVLARMRQLLGIEAFGEIEHGGAP